MKRQTFILFLLCFATEVLSTTKAQPLKQKPLIIYEECQTTFDHSGKCIQCPRTRIEDTSTSKGKAYIFREVLKFNEPFANDKTYGRAFVVFKDFLEDQSVQSFIRQLVEDYGVKNAQFINHWRAYSEGSCGDDTIISLKVKNTRNETKLFTIYDDSYNDSLDYIGLIKLQKLLVGLERQKKNIIDFSLGTETEAQEVDTENPVIQFFKHNF